VVALVEKAAQDLDVAKAEAMAKKLAKGQFDLDMMAEQLSQMKRMGGMEGLMGLLPGVQKVKKQISEVGLTDKMFARQQAIISSMTKEERRKPDILQASRKRRIAKGSGVDVSEINRLLKQHRQMADAFKMMSRGGGKGFAQMAQMLGMGGGGGPGAGGADLARLKALGGGKLPTPEEIQKALPGLGGDASGGLKLPGLGAPPGFNPFKK
jgi:signal recognition particle subunit SRP54